MPTAYPSGFNENNTILSALNASDVSGTFCKRASPRNTISAKLVVFWGVYKQFVIKNDKPKKTLKHIKTRREINARNKRSDEEWGL